MTEEGKAMACEMEEVFQRPGIGFKCLDDGWWCVEPVALKPLTGDALEDGQPLPVG